MIVERQTAIRQLYDLIKVYQCGGPYPTTNEWNHLVLGLSEEEASDFISTTITTSENVDFDETRTICLINTKLSIRGR